MKVYFYCQVSKWQGEWHLWYKGIDGEWEECPRTFATKKEALAHFKCYKAPLKNHGLLKIDNNGGYMVLS